MTNYRKKSVVIEAEQLQWDKVPDLVMHNEDTTVVGVGAYLDEVGRIYLDIETPGGTMTAEPGDWIIKNADGLYGVVAPDYFEKTYESVEQETTA